MKTINTSDTSLGGPKKTSRDGKPTHWLSLALMILVGTGLTIAIAIVLTPEKPLPEVQSEPIDPGPQLATAPSVRFPTPDGEISVEQLQSELLAMAERLASEFGSNVEGLHAAAMTFAEFKQTKRAQEVWQKCLELKPKEVGPYVGMASILSQRGDDEQAVKLLQNAFKTGQRSAELLAELASGLSKLGELEQADAILNEGVASFPESHEIMTQRGTIDMQLQRVESAERAFRKSLELGGNTKAVQMMLANALARQGKTEEATQLRSLSEVTSSAAAKDRSPGFDTIYLTNLRALAVKLFQIGSRAAIENDKPLLAEEWLLRTLAIEPNDLSTYMELSAVYRRTKRLKEALEVQEKLLELQPKNVLNHINLASVASQLGRYDLAERVLTEATLVSPEVAFPFAELAKIHLSKREFSKAKQMITTARNLEPLKTEWHVMGAMIAESLGDAPGVVSCLKRALEITPTDQNLIALLKAAESAK